MGVSIGWFYGAFFGLILTELIGDLFRSRGLNLVYLIAFFLVPSLRALVFLNYNAPVLDAGIHEFSKRSWASTLDVSPFDTPHGSPQRRYYGQSFQLGASIIVYSLTLVGCLKVLFGLALHLMGFWVLGVAVLADVIPRYGAEMLWRRTRVGDYGQWILRLLRIKAKSEREPEALDLHELYRSGISMI